MRIALALLAASQGLATQSVPHGTLAPLIRNGKTARQAHGFWRARGYGYLFAIDETRARHFSICKAGAWKHADDDDTPDILFAMLGSDDRMRVTFHRDIPGYVLERIDSLPAACEANPKWTATRVFDLFAATMSEYYPFFELRGVNWNARLREQRARLGDRATDSQVFGAMEAMLEGLGDGHVSLRATIGGVRKNVHPSGSNTYDRIRHAFEKQAEIKSERAFRKAWIDRFKQQLRTELHDGKLEFTCRRKIAWGRVGEDVGYLFITGMSGFSDGDLDAQLAALHTELDRVLSELADTKGLVVDVSMNSGGMDFFSLAIASHFADRRRLAFSKHPATAKDLVTRRFVTPRTPRAPKGVVYTKPIALVTGSVTASAAEIFTMCMRSLPHVKTFGKPTAGALSDILEKPLPNGWDLGMSNEIYLDHTGKCHEGKGIPPDIEMAIFDAADITRVGHAKAIRRIARSLIE